MKEHTNRVQTRDVAAEEGGQREQLSTQNIRRGTPRVSADKHAKWKLSWNRWCGCKRQCSEFHRCCLSVRGTNCFLCSLHTHPNIVSTFRRANQDPARRIRTPQDESGPVAWASKAGERARRVPRSRKMSGGCPPRNYNISVSFFLDRFLHFAFSNIY